MKRDTNILRKIQQTTTYQINGVTYTRLEDVPADFRALLQDKDGNGIPDCVEAIVKQPHTGNDVRVQTIRTQSATHMLPRSVGQDLAEMLLRDKSRCLALRCAQCGYDLKATPVGGKCPECGLEVAATILQQSSTQQSLAAGRSLMV
jgi:hypothetical protein